MRQELRFEAIAVSGTARQRLPVDSVIDQPQIQMEQESQSTADPNPPLRRAAWRIRASASSCCAACMTRRQRLPASRLYRQPSRTGHPPQGDHRLLRRRAYFYTDKLSASWVKRDMMAFVRRTLAGEASVVRQNRRFHPRVRAENLTGN
jgi:hypothetical protein